MEEDEYRYVAGQLTAMLSEGATAAFHQMWSRLDPRDQAMVAQVLAQHLADEIAPPPAA